MGDGQEELTVLVLVAAGPGPPVESTAICIGSVLVVDVNGCWLWLLSDERRVDGAAGAPAMMEHEDAVGECTAAEALTIEDGGS